MRITEVYPFQPGANTDFQLMGEPGPHSSFIEIYTSQATDLEGYKIIVDGCTLACPRFSRIWHYKALFATDFRDKDGKPCRGFPSSGVVYLYDPAGKLIDERTYSQPGVGESWAPMDATNADSPWASRVPSPGRNLREASFPAKPPGTQEGITSDVATTQLLMSDTVTIREYLNAAYGDEELAAFCFDHFRPAYDSFAAGMTRGHKIQILLEYCERHGAVPQLLTKLARDRPNQFGAQFAEFATTSALHTPRAPGGDFTGRAESMGDAPQMMPPDKWDVFISHASEDKESIARPLAQALEARGLKVWFDEFTLTVGDRLRRSIDRGLANSRHGIVILSPRFFAKEWPQKELDGLVQRENKGEKVILPVWHNITAEQIRAYSLTLADRIGVSSDRGLDQVVAELLRAMFLEPEDLELVHLGLLIARDLVRVPAGEFLMGSDPLKDKLARQDECEQHQVYLDEFHIGKYPVTNRLYRAFVETTRRRAPDHWDGNMIPEGKEEHPVVYVSWDDARAFCGWAAAVVGWSIRLPSEAEWEKAARGADGRLYPWGNEEPDETRCNYDKNMQGTTPVGQYPESASPYGVMDLAGNVWEWTNSLHWAYPYRANDGREGPGNGLRVLRGGAFFGKSKFVRCAVRYGHDPLYWYRGAGFRVVASPSS